MAAVTCWYSWSVWFAPRWELHGRHADRWFSGLFAYSGYLLIGSMWSRTSALPVHFGDVLSSQNGVCLRCVCDCLRCVLSVAVRPFVPRW